MKHILKIWPQYYCRVADGSKTFEVRKNDRGFQPGDEVHLLEWDPDQIEVGGSDPNAFSLHSLSPRTHWKEKGYTNNSRLIFKIGYVYHLDAERVVFSLLPVDKV